MAVSHRSNKMETNNYILLTGSTSGIGEDIALRLSHNYNLILCGRDKDKLHSLIRRCPNNNHKIWKYDLKSLDSLQESLENFMSQNNILVEGFIHCAGYLKMLPLKSISFENITETISVNLVSAILIIKTLIKRKINNNQLTNIIFISSNVSVRGARAFSIYSASKGALNSFMRSLSVELAPTVRVNAILPGGIRTQMTESIFSNTELLQQMNKKYPLGMGKPSDISNLISFLLSDQSRWITGQEFIIDGGRSIDITG